jgi:hypothetical protein
VEGFGVETSFLSTGEAVAYYLKRCVVNLLDIPDSGLRVGFCIMLFASGRAAVPA